MDDFSFWISHENACTSFDNSGELIKEVQENNFFKGDAC